MYRTLRFIAGACFAAFVMVGIGVSAANAQGQTPAQLLQQNPNGGQLLINAIEQLALTNPSSFDSILGAVGGATDQQKIAIATALTQATKTLVLTNEGLAAQWQQKILAITDPAFKTAALNAFGDVKLGAVGGGPLGGPLGGPAGGPGGGAGGSSLQDIRSVPTTTPGFTFASGTAGLGFVGGVGVAGASTPVSGSTSITVITTTGNGNCGGGNGSDPAPPGGGTGNCGPGTPDN